MICRCGRDFKPRRYLVGKVKFQDTLYCDECSGDGSYFGYLDREFPCEDEEETLELLEEELLIIDNNLINPLDLRECY